MTKGQWLSCEDPRPMLEFLRGRVTDRKLRLFATAICRRDWHLLTDKWRTVVDVFERYLDGLLEEPEWVQAWEIAFSADYPSSKMGSVEDLAVRRAYYATAPIALRSGTWHDLAWESAYGATVCENDDEAKAHKAGFASLLRDIAGNPFSPVPAKPSWLTWSNCAAANLAQAIYDEKAFDRLPILADALEDTGCHNDDIVVHCREQRVHVRGCWVVDLILGKQ